MKKFSILSTIALSFLATSAIAQNAAISTLPSANALKAADIVPLVQDGVTKQTTIGAFTTLQSTALPTFTSTVKGFVPPSGGGSTNFLRADGSWAAPPTGGGGTAQTLFPAFYGYVAGGYYINDTTGTGTAPGADSLRLQPVVIQQTATLSGLAYRLTTASSGGNGQGVCYAADPTTKRPTGLPIAQSASVSTTTIGNLDLAFSTSIQLTPNLYWCGMRFDNATAVATSTSNLIGNLTSRVYGFRSLSSGTMDIASTSTTTSAGLVYSAPYASALPDLTSVNPGAATGLNVPAVWFKVASVP